MSRETPSTFITGVAGAIGQGIARACLDQSWRVTLAEIDSNALEAAISARSLWAFS